MKKTRLGKGACDALKELENRLYSCESEYRDSLRATGGIPVTPAQSHLSGLITGYLEAIGVLDKALRVNVRAKAARPPKKS